MHRLHIVVTLCATMLCVLLPAGRTAAQARPGAELTVFLATYGQGDHVWEKFGHNALWIHDGATGRTISYNYGMFEFDQPAFVPRLMKGSMLYTMWANYAQDDVSRYTATNRSITTQRLNLTADQKHELREFLEWNWLPENRAYLYDYFTDNCSTRLRDALDRVLGGRLQSALAGVPTNTTYRSHSLRLTAASVPTYTGLLIGLGMPTDRPINAWQESFIPMELMRHLRTMTVTDEAGSTVPLVAAEEVLFESTRAPALETAPDRTAGYLMAGLLLAALLAGLAHVARGSAALRRRAAIARVALAGALTLWGVTAGLLGMILTLLWIATDHDAAYPNLNLLLLSPLALLLAAAAPLALGSRTPGHRHRLHATGRLAMPLAVALLVLAVVALGLRMLPGVEQANGPLIALLLPVHAAVVYVLYQAGRHEPSPDEDTSGTVRLRAAA